MIFFDAQCERPVLTREAGLFYPEPIIGTTVQEGDKIGEVRDLYEGNVLEEIHTPEAGYVVTLRDHPMVYEKELVAVLLGEKNRRWFWPFG
jgi:hypothetical protein